MTMNPMYAQMGVSGVGAITSFIDQGTAAGLQAKLQKYRNQMLKVTAAMKRRTLTINEVSTRDAAVAMNWEIQKRAQQDQGSAEVSAAAAGVQGGSVDAIARGLRKSELDAQAARKSKYAAARRQHWQDQVDLTVGTIMGQDVTVVEKPNLMSAAMGLGKTLMSDFDRNQPEGDKLADRTLVGGKNPIFGSPQVDWWETTNFHN